MQLVIQVPSSSVVVLLLDESSFLAHDKIIKLKIKINIVFKGVIVSIYDLPGSENPLNIFNSQKYILLSNI